MNIVGIFNTNILHFAKNFLEDKICRHPVNFKQNAIFSIALLAISGVGFVLNKSSLNKKNVILSVTLSLLPIAYAVIAYLNKPPQAPVAEREVSYQRENDTSPLVGLSETQQVFQGTLIRINPSGTPGVNLVGSDPQDRQFVMQRIQQIRTEVGPYAHTTESLKAYRESINKIVFSTINYERNQTPEKIYSLHLMNKRLMTQKFGKQLTAAVIGAGPIGMTAAITFYKLGFKVACYEKRAEEGDESFATRPQPFSLQQQSFWFLQDAGLTSKKLLDSFGYQLTENEINRSLGIVEGAEFLKIGSPIMKDAKIQGIGRCAAEYIPNTMSIHVKTVQRLFSQVITGIQTLDREDITISFDAECTGSSINEHGRRLFHINSEQGIDHDLIYNATGGKVNDIFGFETPRLPLIMGWEHFFRDLPSLRLFILKSSCQELSEFFVPSININLFTAIWN